MDEKGGVEMNAYSPLRDLIEALQQGNRYHISIEFFNKALKKWLQLPRRNIIHATAFCDAVKQRDGGLDRCIRCKGKVMDKVRRERKAFAGLCTFGAYEACCPVYRGDMLLCIIFVGNIIKDEQAFLEKSGLSPEDPLLQTMQRDMTEADCLRIGSLVGSYILMLYENMPEAQEKIVHSTVAAVKGYVDSYYFYELSLAELAKLYHYNEKYLGALFKKQMGISFRDYLNEKRLKNARILLESTSDNVMDVASKSGFNNVTYFNRMFKECYGVTPTKFREEYRKKR